MFWTSKELPKKVDVMFVLTDSYKLSNRELTKCGQMWKESQNDVQSKLFLPFNSLLSALSRFVGTRVSSKPAYLWTQKISPATEKQYANFFGWKYSFLPGYFCFQPIIRVIVAVLTSIWIFEKHSISLVEKKVCSFGVFLLMVPSCEEGKLIKIHKAQFKEKQYSTNISLRTQRVLPVPEKTWTFFQNISEHQTEKALPGFMSFGWSILLLFEVRDVLTKKGIKNTIYIIIYYVKYNLKTSLKFKLLAFWRKWTPFIDQKCTYEKMNRQQKIWAFLRLSLGQILVLMSALALEEGSEKLDSHWFLLSMSPSGQGIGWLHWPQLRNDILIGQVFLNYWLRFHLLGEK